MDSDDFELDAGWMLALGSWSGSSAKLGGLSLDRGNPGFGPGFFYAWFELDWVESCQDSSLFGSRPGSVVLDRSTERKVGRKGKQSEWHEAAYGLKIERAGRCGTVRS